MFVGFRRNLEITDLQERVAAVRQERVRAAVARGLTVQDSFLTGSYRRRTMIGPLRADVDIVTVLDRIYRRRGPRAVLDLVKSTLQEEYPSSRVSRNGQAVTIRFSDFTVDVVPAFVPWWDSNSQFLIAVLLPMLPALLDATDLCQAHWRAAAERTELEHALDGQLDQAAHGNFPQPENLRVLQDEINRQRLVQPPVPDWYYRLRRISSQSSMQVRRRQTLPLRNVPLPCWVSDPPVIPV